MMMLYILVCVLYYRLKRWTEVQPWTCFVKSGQNIKYFIMMESLRLFLIKLQFNVATLVLCTERRGEQEWESGGQKIEIDSTV